jgi:membrane protease YdiL (CAAX protease family)
VSRSVRFLAVGEALLLVAGLLWAWVRSVAVPFHFDLEALGQSVAVAAAFSIGNLSLYHLSKKLGYPSAVHSFLEKEVLPLLRHIRIHELVLLVLLVGAGEELFFRGVLQAEIGLLAASVIFGILHGPARSLWPLAIWATLMGVLFGVLYKTTANLAVPALAHAIYDGVAIWYLKVTVPPADRAPPVKGDGQIDDEIH